MSIAETFDTGRFYLGDMCPNGHEFEASGFSLRYHSNKICVACHRESGKKWRRENPEKVREKNRKWYSKNLEKARRKNRKWRRENPKKFREQKRMYRSCLMDSYVRSYLKSQFGVPEENVTPELIAMKKEQLELHRNIQTLSNKEKNNGII